MSQQMDAAVPTRIQSLETNMAGRKLRLAGRLLSYDIATALILLLDKDQAVLVDVSLCVNPSSSWVRERLGVLMIIGYIETSSVQVPIPTIPAYAPAPVIDPQLLFRALRVIQASDLDLDLWNLAIEERAKADVYTG